jgi:RNA recognition motif-containing protein
MILIYVGNLSYEATANDLRRAFSSFGEVSSVEVVKDNATGRSRGFGFVEMPNDMEAQSALSGLNLRELRGRTMTLSVARPRRGKPRRHVG